MAFLLYISSMKNQIRICTILCMSAMLSTVASANPAQVPKTEHALTTGVHVYEPTSTFIIEGYAVDACDMIIVYDRYSYVEAGSMAKAISKGFSLDAEMFRDLPFEGKVIPGWKEPEGDINHLM